MTEDQWISVKDELPNRYGKVLVAQATGDVFIGMWEHRGYWLNGNDLEIEAPTHWMPLPKPPAS